MNQKTIFSLKMKCSIFQGKSIHCMEESEFNIQVQPVSTYLILEVTLPPWATVSLSLKKRREGSYSILILEKERGGNRRRETQRPVIAISQVYV